MPFARKLAYSLGALATALSYQAIVVYLVFFYVDIVKLPPHLAALGMIIFGLWNAINDPIFGYLSDQTRSRWGRRRPYLAFGAIPFGVTFFLLWSPPFNSLDQTLALFVYFTLLICLFDAFYSLVAINWASLYPEMFTSLAERSEVNTLKQACWMLGACLGIAVPPFIFGTLGWPWLGAIFGGLIVLAVFAALWGSRENLVFSQTKQLGLGPALKATFKNRSFVTFALANVFVQYTLTLVLAMVPFFAKYVLGITNQDMAALPAAAFLMALLMLPVWRKIVVALGAKKSFMWSLAFLAASLLPFFFIVSFVGAFLASFFIGIGVSGFILLADIMLSDIIDEDELATGTRREGTYFGINNLITRLAIALEVLSLGAVFVLTNYNRFVFTQSAQFIAGLRLLIAGFPLIALAIAFVIICFYPLSGQRLEALRDKITARHEEKGVK